MILKRLYNSKLSQASFVVGCEKTREAVAVDPNRHLDNYLEVAAEEGLRITAVTETHIHADYLSGSRELAQRTGATLYLSDEGGAEWKYAFGQEPKVSLVRGGDSIWVGKVRLDVVHMPGHTPEHICFVITDESASPEPLGILTGDFLFVGDVGRPDLLEKAANLEGTMEKGARVLYGSLLQLKEMAPSLMLWPGHGSGSACGKALGGLPVTTLAYEKLTNWALRVPSEQEFVQEVLEGQPEPPSYFREMKLRNKNGPAILGGLKPPSRMAGNAMVDLLRDKAVIVDIRPAGVVAGGYVPGTLNIPMGSSFVNWSGWLLPYDTSIYLIAESQEETSEAANDLSLIGLDEVKGWFGKDALRSYERTYGTLPITPQTDMAEATVLARSGEAEILDVRSSNEYIHGHVPGAIHIPLGYLSNRSHDVPKVKPVHVHCGGGVRSAIATSVLHRLGFENVFNIPGGFCEYEELGLPIEIPAPHAVSTS